MKEQLEQHVKKVKELHEACNGNEATTKACLIAPLFVMLGWDMTHPKECIPEFRADFGKGEKAATPVDWMFSLTTPAFIVEAKECSKKLKSYAEQLGMYFAKARVNLGIYTNGVQWQFYTDLDAGNLMDKEPFLVWDILNDDPIPIDFLTILQKSQFQPQLVKTFAERGRKQNLLVAELSRLLEPSPEFIKLAAQNIESATLTVRIVEQWKPILANALQEWVKLKALDMALERPNREDTKTGEVSKTKSFKGKTCPQCGATGLGNRLQKCKCGYEFVSTKADDVVQEAQPEQAPASDPTIPFVQKDVV